MNLIKFHKELYAPVFHGDFKDLLDGDIPYVGAVIVVVELVSVVLIFNAIKRRAIHK